MAIDLYGNNSELVRAAFTAMDQTYGTVGVNTVLQPIDNSARIIGDRPRLNP